MRKSWKLSRSANSAESAATPAIVPTAMLPIGTTVAGAANVAAREALAAAAKQDSVTLPIGFGLRLRLEKAFWLMALTSVLLYISAGEIGNEWLYLLCAGFMLAPVIGTIYPLFMLALVRVDVDMPKHVLYGEGAPFVIKLRSKSNRFLEYVFSIRCLALAVSLLQRSSRQGEDQVVDIRQHVLDSLNHQAWFQFRTSILKRGVYRLKGVQLGSSFPFGITTWWRSIPIAKEAMPITVYPRIIPLAGNFMQHLNGIVALIGLNTASAVIRHNSTFYRGVREFKSGDSWRHMHWATTARKGALFVKEYEQEVQPIFDLHLNLQARWRSKEQFELAVCTIASLCNFGFQNGMIPNLVLTPSLDSSAVGAQLSDVPPGASGLEQLLEILTRVEPILAARDQSSTSGIVAGNSSEERQVLAVLPTGEQVLMYFPEVGDVSSFPVEITVIPADPEAAEASSAGSEPDRNSPLWKLSVGGQSNETIGSIAWEGDLATL